MLAQLVESPQGPPVVVVLLQMLEGQQVLEVEPQEQILQQILDPDFDPLLHHYFLLALRHPLQSGDQQLESKAELINCFQRVCKLLTSPFLRQL